MGGSFVCLNGYMCASQNQAGLGFIEYSSLSVQHGRPYWLTELGISSFSGQFSMGNGALGLMLSSMGLKGLLAFLWAYRSRSRNSGNLVHGFFTLLPGASGPLLTEKNPCVSKPDLPTPSSG
jgi:hypothetical protein